MKKYLTGIFAIVFISYFITSVFSCNKKELLPPTRIIDTAVVSGNGGSTNGTGVAAKFNRPFGIAADAAGNLYVADAGNNLIRKISPGAVVTTLAGMAGISGAVNGTDTLASFNQPFGVAVDGAGNVYVADGGNNMIRIITPAGAVTTFAGTGRIGGSNVPDSITFNSPLSVAADAGGNIYVADYGNNQVRKITPAGVVSTLAGSGATGSTDGSGTAASFDLPEGIAADASGNLYVADNGNNLIRKITPDGVVTTLAGSGKAGSANGTGPAASFNSPFGIAVDASGNIYVADSGNNLIRKITPAGVVSTLAGNGARGAGNATGTAASFNTPSGVAVDGHGNIYVADENNNLIREISPAGAVTTLANRPARGIFKPTR